ncbi:MAG: hypothetical protein ACOYKN_17525 [Pirellula sp.]
MSENPYEPTGSAYGSGSLDSNVDLSQAEIVRKSHLSHEANLQGFGCLYTFGGILGIFVGLFSVARGVSILAGGLPQNLADPASEGLVGALIGLVVLAISVVQLMAGRSLRTLNPKGKMLAVIVTAIGLLNPCGIPIFGYLLYLLLSAKGEMVFSDRYKEIIQATPHIKYKTSIIVWIFLFLLIAVILMGIIAAVVSRG